MSDKRPIYINISALSVFKIFSIFLLFFFLFIIRDILAILFIALILSSALDPWVDWMQDKKIPRSIGVIIIYALMFMVISFAFILVIPPIVDQTSELISNYPELTAKINTGIEFIKEKSTADGFVDSLISPQDGYPGFVSTAGEVVNKLFGIFGGIFTFFLVLVMTFYMIVEEDAVRKLIWSITPSKNRVYVMHLVSRMQKKVGLWLRGQIILSMIIFLLILLGLSMLNVKYALVLAFLAGLTEFVPYLGPTIAAVPALFLAFTQNGLVFMGFVGLLYYIVQVIENNYIVPKVMQKVVGLNPIVSIAVLLIGFKIGGIPGAILSIPVATAINVFIMDIFEQKNIEENNAKNNNE